MPPAAAAAASRASAALCHAPYSASADAQFSCDAHSAALSSWNESSKADSAEGAAAAALPQSTAGSSTASSGSSIVYCAWLVCYVAALSE